MLPIITLRTRASEAAASLHASIGLWQNKGLTVGIQG